MEARLEADLSHFYGMSAGAGVGTRSVEWKLNDWKWDGDLFLARSLNPVGAVAVPPQYLGQQFFPVDSRGTAGNSSISSSSCSDEVNLGTENGKGEVEKRRRVIEVEDDRLEDKASALTLKLGGQGYSVAERDEGNSGKKAKVVGASTNRAACQVVDCGADLSNAKDYHRRHKVCEMHSKTTSALVGNIMQRFCQQCSRFHALQEFDEGKRSCRRRLAGHNKRRRKINPDTSANANPSNNDQTSSYLLISLLKILSNMQTNQSNQVADQDLLTHLLRSLASNQAHQGKNVCTLLQESQNIVSGGASVAKSEAIPTLLSKGVEVRTTTRPMLQPHTESQTKANNFDLNNVYVDFDDGTEDLESSPVPANDCPSWMQQDSRHSSPPQTSRTSDSASGQSPSSSSGDTQSRTDRIVFKLFGKEPNDFPLLVRAQILDWLAHSPTDIESYIRPGCIVLTVYLRQAEDAWKELCCGLSTSLSRLLDVSDDTFWKTGWMYVRVQHQMALIYNGQFVLNTSLPFRSINTSKILRVSPIAVSASDNTQFLVRGFNLSQPSARLHCSLEGQYLLQEEIDDLIDDCAEEDDELECVKFSCSIPSVTGRGFIEIEDGGLSSSFFPFIVAEESICSEICTLESTLESLETDSDTDGTTETESKNEAVEFIHEMGWILHRSGSRSRLGHLNPNSELFSFKRLRWLVEFSMDRDWCAVVKKLLDIMLDGTVGAGDHLSMYSAVLDMGLVHRAVRRNCRPLVDLLLRYVPQRVGDNLEQELELILVRGRSQQRFLFKPDAVGPGGLTPLHIAAGRDGSEGVLDALTDDPGMVGMEAWKKARDSTGSTPEDYARLRGHYSYIHLVQRKLNKRPQPLPPHVVLDILNSSSSLKDNDKATSLSFSVTKPPGSCKMCDNNSKKLRYGIQGRSLLYRPAMLSMVAIAAVCVCVALLFKSCPEVLYVFRPFRWEMLEFGTS